MRVDWDAWRDGGRARAAAVLASHRRWSRLAACSWGGRGAAWAGGPSGPGFGDDAVGGLRRAGRPGARPDRASSWRARAALAALALVAWARAFGRPGCSGGGQGGAAHPRHLDGHRRPAGLRGRGRAAPARRTRPSTAGPEIARPAASGLSGPRARSTLADPPARAFGGARRRRGPGLGDRGHRRRRAAAWRPPTPQVVRVQGRRGGARPARRRGQPRRRALPQPRGTERRRARTRAASAPTCAPWGADPRMFGETARGAAARTSRPSPAARGRPPPGLPGRPRRHPGAGEVIEAISGYYRTSNANTHGQFVTSRETDALIAAAREAVAALPRRARPAGTISFGQNMTTLVLLAEPRPRPRARGRATRS